MGAAGRDLIRKALDAARSSLDEREAKSLLAMYGIPTPAGTVVHDAQRAAAAVEALGGPAVLKALGPDIQHKSDLGLVELDVRDAAAARAAYHRIVDRAAGRASEGVLVEELVPHERELLGRHAPRRAVRPGHRVRPGRHLHGGGRRRGLRAGAARRQRRSRTPGRAARQAPARPAARAPARGHGSVARHPDGSGSAGRRSPGDRGDRCQSPACLGDSPGRRGCAGDPRRAGRRCPRRRGRGVGGADGRRSTPRHIPSSAGPRRRLLPGFGRGRRRFRGPRKVGRLGLGEPGRGRLRGRDLPDQSKGRGDHGPAGVRLPGRPSGDAGPRDLRPRRGCGDPGRRGVRPPRRAGDDRHRRRFRGGRRRRHRPAGPARARGGRRRSHPRRPQLHGRPLHERAPERRRLRHLASRAGTAQRHLAVRQHRHAASDDG